MVVINFLAFPDIVSAQTPSCIEFTPGQTVNVGDEVILFGKPCATFTDFASGKYEWDFGDDLTEDAQGIAVSHFYMRPGTFTVKLWVTPGVLVDEGDPDTDQDDVWVWPVQNRVLYTGTITVTGTADPKPPFVTTQPILELDFEDSIADTSGHNVPVQWAGVTGGFTDGIEGRALDLTQGGYLAIPNGGQLMGGLSEFTLSFWFKKTAPANFGHIMHQYDAYEQSQTGQGLRLYFGVDCTKGPDADPFYGMNFRTVEGLMRPAHYNNAGTDDTRWHHGAVTYSSSTGLAHLYLDGLEVGSSPYNASGILSTSPVTLTIGGDWDGLNIFGGYLDQLKIYDQALTQAQIHQGIVIRHADFHARQAQYITVQIPETFRSDPQAQLRAFITGGALNPGQEVVLVDKTNLQPLEKFLLRNADLDGSNNDYLFTVQLFDENTNLVYENVEPFLKTYDSVPAYSLDENNALRKNGQVFFPVMPYGLNNPDIDDWIQAGYINILYGHGFWGEGAPQSFTIPAYQTYLDTGLANGVGTIGPTTRWEGQGYAYTQSGLTINADLDEMANYINTLKDHEGVIAWNWLDEPNLWAVYAQTLRAWTALSHRLDNQHLVATNYMGHVYSDCASDFRKAERKAYTYEYNSNQFGRRTPMVDIAKFDIYPIDSAPSGNTLECYISALENFRLENGGFLPTWSSIETADATGANGQSPWDITPAQLRMMVWLNVVHEMKGILWFHYFGGTPADNFVEMARFTRQVNELAPAILGPRTDHTVLVFPDQTARIDTMIRQYNGDLYLFAVRVSEVEDDDYGRGYVDPQQTYTVKAALMINDVVEADVEVYEESRTLDLDYVLADDFAPYDVHIYKLTNIVNSNQVFYPDFRGTPGNETIALDWTVYGNLPADVTWRIDYQGASGGTPPSPVIDLANPTRDLTLSSLTNGEVYTITLSAIQNGAVIQTNTIQVTPRVPVFLPVVLK
jgi:hypothetical protein